MLTKRQKGLLRLATAVILGFCFSFGGGQLGNWWQIQPATAQFVEPQEIAPYVYEIVPDFPKENEYISQDTGEVAEDHTLISRIISYHLYSKSRLPNFRLDWKLTLADYLGAFQEIDESRYPGNNTLTANPVLKDIEVVRSLTRAEREELVVALLQVFNPRSQKTKPETPENTPSPQPSPNRRQPPSLPGPGAADLLL